MSGDVAAADNHVHAQNGGSCEVQSNGVTTNGHHHHHHHTSSSSSSSKHKSSSKDKHRDKERDHKTSSSSKEHKSSKSDKERGDKHHHSSSSTSSSSGKDKHRDKDRESNNSHSSSTSTHHRSSSSTSSSSHRDKDKIKHKSSSSSSSSNHHHKSSSSSKDKDRKDKDRKDGGGNSSSSNSSNRDKDTKDKDKDTKDKDKETKDKDKDIKDKDTKDKDKDKEHRHHKSSSSSTSSTSSSRDKDKERSHHKSSSSSSSSKSKHSSSSSKHHSSSKSSSSSSSHHDQKQHPPQYDGVFIKPEPLMPLNDIVKLEQKNGYESKVVCNGNNYKNGYVENSGGVGSLVGTMTTNVDMMIKKESQHDSSLNVSQASSCDYSMSQFNSDEPPFVVKQEASYTDDSMLMIQSQDENAAADDDEDLPLAVRKRKSNLFPLDDDDEENENDDDDVPLLARKRVKKESKESKESSKKSSKKRAKDDLFDDHHHSSKSKKKKSKKEKHSHDIKIKAEPTTTTTTISSSTTKRARKDKKEEEEEVWRWWEEEKREDGVKWNTLEHKGPVFAPLYERLPRNVRFFYDGKHLELSEETEEAATFYAKMLNHDYCTKDIFNNNFFKDFRRSMTSKEREIIKDFGKCNFKEMHQYFLVESEKRKAATKEEKNAKKLENEAIIKEYGFCMIDGHKEKIGNFRLEPPGLFRGRGEHPKMGMIKRRIHAGDVSINCGKGSKIPTPPQGHRWKEVRHDNTVTWLASWIENVQGQVKYIMLNPSSKLKGEKDHIKYETARRLAKSIDKIRSTYRDEWKSKEMRVRQRAVALYFIDILALRAGNEKDEDQADTVGCCSLRVEHVQLHKHLNGKENVVVFDFLGKDSIRYYNEVEVEKRVFKNLELFMENKKDGDDLFDRLNTQVLNEHLKELMDGLTAKVFRTYNASITLQNQLDLLTDGSATVPEKLLAYNRANRAVAILCNHQRSVPKGHQKSMENLKEKIRAKREAIDDCESEYYDLKKAGKRGSVKEKVMADKKGKQLERLKDQLKKMELQETDRDENKTIALGTSKLNYLDPRISVAWCKKNNVPIEKIFNKTQRTKFLWAIHMADENYRF